MYNNINNHYIKADNVCDYIPVVSTFTNLINIFQKCVINLFLNKTIVDSSHYYTHLKEKSFARCVFLLIPTIGNICIALYDWYNRNFNNDNEESVLADLAAKTTSLRFVSERLCGNKKVVLAAIAAQKGRFDSWDSLSHTGHVFSGNDVAALHYASSTLTEDAEFMRIAAKGATTRYASNALKSDKSFMLEMVQKDGNALKCASSDLQNDKEVVDAAVKQNGWTLRYAGEALKNNKEIVLLAVRQHGGALEHAGSVLQDDEEVVRAAITTDIHAMKFASKRLKNDKNFMLAAITTIDPYIAIFASDRLKDDKEFKREVAALKRKVAALNSSHAVASPPQAT